MLPYSRQSIDASDIEAVVAVLQSKWLTTGPAVDEFERTVGDLVEADYAVSFCNGTAALHAAMEAIGIGPGDEVLVPAMTFAATANCVLYQGGRPVFADIDPKTMLIDADSLESRITARTKAIIAVDYAGQPCDYPRLREIADRHRLVLVADACHAFGASLHDKPVGSLADLTCFSFHPVKPVTTGEGGMVVTSSAVYDQALRLFRNHGIDKDFRQRESSGSHVYAMTSLGFNYRLSDLHAALGTSQVRRIDQLQRRRANLADRYYSNLQSMLDACRPLSIVPKSKHAYHLFVVKFLGANGVERDRIFQAMRGAGIGVNVHYLPVYRHPYYEQLGYRPGICPIAEAVYEQILSLPMFPGMTMADVDRVCHQLGMALGTRVRQMAA